MKNILHVVNKLNYGGAEKQLYYIVNNLTEYNHHVISLKGTGPWDDKFKNISNFSVLNVKKYSSIKNFIRIISQLYRYIKTNNIQIVHSWLYHPNAICSLLKILFPEIKFVVSKQGQNFWYKKYHFWVNRFVYRIADLIFVNSEILRKQITSYVPSANSKIIKIFNVIDISYEFDCNLPKYICEFKNDNKFIIGSVGRLVAEKDYFVMINAIEKLRQKYSNFVYIIIGDGPCRKEIQEQIIARDLQKHVVLEGYRSDALCWYSSFDAYLLGSYSEGLPNTILEALAFGVPIVSTQVGAVPEVIQDHVNGLLVPIGDSQEIANALFRIIYDLELRKSLSRKALATSEKFSIQNVNEYNKLYEF